MIRIAQLVKLKWSLRTCTDGRRAGGDNFNLNFCFCLRILVLIARLH